MISFLFSVFPSFFLSFLFLVIILMFGVLDGYHDYLIFVPNIFFLGDFLNFIFQSSMKFSFQYHTSKHSFNSDWILKNYGSTLFHAYNIFPYLSEENNEFFWSFIFHE